MGADRKRALGALDSPRAVSDLIAVLQTDASPGTRTDAAYGAPCITRIAAAVMILLTVVSLVVATTG